MSQTLEQEKTKARIAREQAFFDELEIEGSKSRKLLDRFSEAFYDETANGRLWGPVWRGVDFRGKAVLDYGCGDGHFTRMVAQAGGRAVGIDISPQLVMRAERSNPKQRNGFPKFLVGDAHSTPFADASFDFVVGNSALHHFDLDAAYPEVVRLLKPGGTGLFMEPMYHHPLLWVLRRLTPNNRTDDEKPLSIGDIEKASRWFRTVVHREHFLMAVCAAPAHLLGRSFALRTITMLDRVDRALFQLIPGLRNLAWLTMTEMQK